MLSAVALFLSAIGAINWGLIGGLNFNVVVWLALLLKLPILVKILYITFGVAGLFSLFDCFSCTFSK